MSYEMKIRVKRWEYQGKFKAEMASKGKLFKRLEADSDLELSHKIGKALDELLAMIQKGINIKVEYYFMSESGWRLDG